MKKLLMTTLCVIALATTVNASYAKGPEAPNKMTPETKQEFVKKMQEHQKKFDERLQLTPEQKVLAEKNRKEGRAKMEPVMKDIKAKKEELKAIRESGKSEAETKKLTEPIKKDLKALRGKANELRQENMKNFEAILTPEQKVEFDKMKEEGKAKRAEMKKNHKGPRGPHKCGADCQKNHKK